MLRSWRAMAARCSSGSRRPAESIGSTAGSDRAHGIASARSLLCGGGGGMLINGFLWFERVMTRVALIAAVVALAVAVSLAFYQVIVRFVFESPSTWSAAATRTLVIWSVFLGAAHAFRTDSMMRVELIYTALPERWHRWIETLVTLLCIVFFALLAWYGYKMGVRVSRQVLAGLNISIAWAYAALPVGSVFVIIALIARYLERVVRGVPPAPADPVGLSDDQPRTRP